MLCKLICHVLAYRILLLAYVRLISLLANTRHFGLNPNVRGLQLSFSINGVGVCQKGVAYYAYAQGLLSVSISLYMLIYIYMCVLHMATVGHAYQTVRGLSI